MKMEVTTGEEQVSQLDQALIEVIERASSGVEAGVGFLTAELPEVVDQLLMWSLVHSLVINVVALTCFGFSAWFCLVGVRKIKAYNWAWEGDEKTMIVLGYILGGIALFFSLVFLNLQWLQIWLAPKVWLIEYSADLVSK